MKLKVIKLDSKSSRESSVDSAESQICSKKHKPSPFDDSYDYAQGLKGVALTYSERPAGNGMVITPMRDPPKEVDLSNTKGTQAE